ncbi:hypothetical protein BKA66DRAFT_116260 [Pyrenochaeta sp. MPI-SDFR-AT-0127]|nr:hypothetical protein BKA66DRAFT_116260 [Pyrenochaeta sp. MPI-SDFR-AT-0127]
MLSPNDIAPKSKAASIWSFDSGYGSNTLEDDESFQAPTLTDESSQASYFGSSVKTQIPPQTTQRPIGLGLDGLWNVQFEDQLRITTSALTIRPVTTKLNVFTTKQISGNDFLLPSLSDSQKACVSCQLWAITNPGEGLKCDDCRDKRYVTPEELHFNERVPKEKLVIPRLEIPHEQQSTKPSRSRYAGRCSACEMSKLVDPTNTSNCTSCSPDPDLLSPISPVRSPKVKRSCARRPTKLPPQALRCLQLWLRENCTNPYPDAETKRSLAEECGITEKQVNTWFTNARARRLHSSADRSNPQSEDEGNYESGISSLTTTPICNNGLPFGSGVVSDRRCSDATDIATSGFNLAVSTTLTTPRRGKKKDYGHMSTVSPIDNQQSPIPPTPITAAASGKESEPETWQCTFCYQQIAPKSWRRHEETQHRPKRKWTCLLNGPQLTVPSHSTSSIVCAFCMAENPSEDHFLRTHRILECMKKSENERTFLRPDHLRQHVKNFHKAQLWDIVRDSWRRDGPKKDDIENWACGFCGQQLKTWDIRQTHIAAHFKEGFTMADWRDHKQPTSAIEPTKKRRNSNAEFSHMLSKLARTLTGRSNRQIDHRNQSHSQFSNTWESLPTSAGPSVSATPLLPDMVFDTFMAEVCGNCVDSCNPTPTTPVAQYPGHSNVTEATAQDEDNGELDFESLADAFLNGSSMEFQGPWDEQQE